MQSLFKILRLTPVTSFFFFILGNRIYLHSYKTSTMIQILLVDFFSYVLMQRMTSNKFPVNLIFTFANPCCSSKPRYSGPLLSFPSVCTSMFKDWSKAVLLFFFSSSSTISASKIPQPNLKTNACNSANPLSSKRISATTYNCAKHRTQVSPFFIYSFAVF